MNCRGARQAADKAEQDVRQCSTDSGVRFGGHSVRALSLDRIKLRSPPGTDHTCADSRPWRAVRTAPQFAPARTQARTLELRSGRTTRLCASARARHGVVTFTPRKELGMAGQPLMSLPQCGAHARSTGRPCRRSVEWGKRRCRSHGGLTPPYHERPDGQHRIAEAQRCRWQRWRAARD
jgi:hypothetical protein